VCKMWTKNSQLFGEKCQKTSGGGNFLTDTVDSESAQHVGELNRTFCVD